MGWIEKGLQTPQARRHDPNQKAHQTPPQPPGPHPPRPPKIQKLEAILGPRILVRRTKMTSVAAIPAGTVLSRVEGARMIVCEIEEE